MLIFLDTNIISYYLNSKELIVNNVMRYFDNDEILCTTIINVYEMQKGFKWKNNRQKETTFKLFLDELEIYSMSNSIINIASNIYSDLRKKGYIS
jgi:tRNA(fMet)-specific endonuclease VapC